VDVLIHKHAVRRPNGDQVVVEEHWDFVDVSPRQTGTDWAPGGKRFVLSTGETVYRIDDGVFQLGSNGEILLLDEPGLDGLSRTREAR